jgi:hypothetical protein
MDKNINLSRVNKDNYRQFEQETHVNQPNAYI